MKGDRLARGGSLHTAPNPPKAWHLILGLIVAFSVEGIVDWLFTLGGR